MADSIIDFTNVKNPWTQSSSSSGIPTGPARTSISNTVQGLSGMLPSWTNSLDKASSMPAKIDAWADERIKHQTIGADDWARGLGAVNRQRLGAGIIGGTESQNLRGNVMAQIYANLIAKKDAIRAGADQAKLATRMALPQLYAQPIQQMGALGGLLRDTQAQAYQEDPSAWGDIIAKLIVAGYTG